MRETRSYGSVRGAAGNSRPYREQFVGNLAVSTGHHGRWLSVLATDVRNLVSRPVSLALPRRAEPSNRLFGVVVGIDAYREPGLPPLKYAVSDARRIAALLRGPGAANYYGAREIGAPIVDGEATAETILASLRSAIERAGPADTILFSFAGHGLGSASDGGYFMALAGTRLDRLAQTGLAWSDVSRVLQSAKARVVVLLDSCQSGLTGAQGLATNDEAVSALLAGARAPVIVLAASKGRQDANEDPKWGGGLFTFALGEVLDSRRAVHDTNGNGAIEVSELYAGLKAIVIRESNGTQTPWLARHDLIGDFALF